MRDNRLSEDFEWLQENGISIKNMRGKSVFITGATGLIGSLIARYLLYYDDSIRVIALIRDTEKAKMIYRDDYSRVIWLKGDINSEFDYSGEVDYVIHAAAVTTSAKMINEPVETIMTAVKGTYNILKFSYEKKVQSVVYLSSMEMYGSFEDDKHEVREDDLGYIDPLRVRSNYPESKRMCENMCIAFMTEYHVPVKIARLAQTFGAGILPGESRVFAQFANCVLSKRDIVLHTEGLSEGNYCYTRDAVNGIFYILLKGNSGQAYNISNPASHTTIVGMANMVCDKIAEGRINVVFDIPKDNRFGYASDVKMKLNSDKLQQLGWRPEVGLEESYRRMIDSINDN